MFNIYPKVHARQIPGKVKTSNISSISSIVDGSELLHEDFFNALREKEYFRLDEQRQVYFDFTGGNLYADSQIASHFDLLKGHTFGNPHSTNPTSRHSTALVDAARAAVIEFFNAGDYHCIFTQNASGALKVVGECYPFDQNGALVLLADNHNSVNGIREYCQRKKGPYEYVPIQFEDLKIDESILEESLSGYGDKENKLFAYPAQSNVTGVKHDLSWVARAQSKGWDVLLDAAAFVPTTKLDLKEIQPDFVSVSFYKIFGYPTGVGCLLAKKSKYGKLIKPWFAGGTVTLAAVKTPYHYLAENHERFENGTVSYLDLPAIKTGLDFITEIGMERISERVQSMAEYLYENLTCIKYDNGSPVVRVFGPEHHKEAGGTLIMTFFKENGQPIEFERIEEMANKQNISVRSGCFCNPGIDEINNCLTSEELAKYFSSRDKGDYHDMITFLNKMRGATRISVGLATVKRDLDAFLEFVKGLRTKDVG